MCGNFQFLTRTLLVLVVLRCVDAQTYQHNWSNELVSISWSIENDEKTIAFRVSSPVTGYVAIGFSKVHIKCRHILSRCAVRFNDDSLYFRMAKWLAAMR